MKQKYYLAFFLVSVAWLIFTLSPPWISVSFDAHGLACHEFCGYGFIFAPPDPSIGSIASRHIDFIRLVLKYVSSVIVIVVLASKWKKPVTLSYRNRPSQVKASLVGLSAFCLVSTAVIVRDDAQSQFQAVAASKDTKSVAFKSAPSVNPNN